MGSVLHFDCFSGISGDMTLGALLDLGVPEQVVQEAVGSLDLPGKLVIERVRKNGFSAIKIDVEVQEEHTERNVGKIRAILDRGKLTDNSKKLALSMFEKLAEAEAATHGIPIEKVHFHEVGAVDSIFDFVGVAVGIDWLAPQRITSTPVPTGSGWVECKHGTLPVPAPAVANLLRGIPLSSSRVQGELTTPTGAAIIASFASEFVALPEMTVQKIGLGAGTRDYPEQPNLLRLFLGEEASKRSRETADQVWQLQTNLDDVTPEVLGYCFDRLFEEGALDVFTQPIQMKKNRPGVLLTVLCSDEELPSIERVLFQETGTFGLRKYRLQRTKLNRQAVEVQTRWGLVKGKLGWNGQCRVLAPEYDDCVQVAQGSGVPLRTVYQEAVRQLNEEFGSTESSEK